VNVQGFNLETGKLHNGAEGYPLRPESIESIYYLHKATGDPVWLSMGIDTLVSIQVCKCQRVSFLPAFGLF
jgi:hypothetical protein